VTFLAILIMIAAFNQWDNPTAWVYLALHGSYGWLWVLKSRLFPDKSWERPSSLAWGMVIWGGLTMYWIAPLLLLANNVRLPAYALGLLVALYILGMFLHYVSDMQKHMALTLRPGVLITDGLWALCRNPNYLGEFLIYLSFALLSAHWLPVLILLAFVATVWLPNMRQKDRSLSRYAEFAAYQRRTRQFIPGLF
jgi:protein-S-isoprenylcysteine O-methyltransferase Ste14